MCLLSNFIFYHMPKTRNLRSDFGFVYINHEWFPFLLLYVRHDEYFEPLSIERNISLHTYNLVRWDFWLYKVMRSLICCEDHWLTKWFHYSFHKGIYSSVISFFLKLSWCFWNLKWTWHIRLSHNHHVFGTWIWNSDLSNLEKEKQKGTLFLAFRWDFH